MSESLERELNRARTEGMILTKLDNIEAKLDKVFGEIARLEERITTLEAWRYKLIGACTIIGASAGIITGLLT